MNYSQFETEIMDILSEKLADECEIVPTTVTKNNNTTLRGLRFARKDSVVHPTMYLEGYFKMYVEGKSLEEIASLILDSYREAVLEDTPDLSYLMDYSAMKERVVCKLINAVKNRQLLKEVPHVLFLDLAIVFYCRVELPGAGEGTTLIYNRNFETWGITVEEMYRDALKNNERLLGGSTTPIATVLKEIWHKMSSFEALDPCPELAADIPMYVLTNRLGLNGAACMLNKRLLQEFSDNHGGDFYIIPSSVHELILLPADKDKRGATEELKEIVRTINKTELPAAEVLSDEVYLYNREKKAVVMA